MGMKRPGPLRDFFAEISILSNFSIFICSIPSSTPYCNTNFSQYVQKTAGFFKSITDPSTQKTNPIQSKVGTADSRFVRYVGGIRYALTLLGSFRFLNIP